MSSGGWNGIGSGIGSVSSIGPDLSWPPKQALGMFRDVDLRPTAAEAFRTEVRDWLGEHLRGEFAALGGAGGPGREHEGFEVRLAWERELGKGGWIGLDLAQEHGGRGAGLDRQVIWAEEYARAGAPARVNHMGEHLLAPT